MRLKFFAVPVEDAAAAEAEVNRFLAAHRVLDLEKHLVSRPGGGVWALCISYIDTNVLEGTRKERVDYREALEPVEFAR